MPPHLAQVESRVTPCSFLFSREKGSQREGYIDPDAAISPSYIRFEVLNRISPFISEGFLIVDDILHPHLTPFSFDENISTLNMPNCF